MAQADYTLALGRLLTVTVLEELKESYGDGLDAVGPVLVGPEAKPRPFSLTLPVSGNAHRTDWYEAGRRLRRQVHGLMENTAARLEGLYLRWDVDPESNGWLLVGGGDLEAQDGGVTFADWKLTLTDCYRVGSLATHREARAARLYDRRGQSIPKDTLRRVYGATFAALAPLPLIYLPVGAYDIAGYNGRLPTVGSNVLIDTSTTAPVVADAASGEVFSFERPESQMTRGDVIVRNRNGAGALTVAGHSFCYGSGLAAPATGNYGYLTSQLWGVPYRNFAVGGAFAAIDENTARPGALNAYPGNGYVLFLQTIKRAGWPAVDASPMGDRAALILGFGLNDLHAAGLTASPLNTVPFVEAYRTIARRHRASVVCEHNDSTISYGSGWTTQTTSLYNSGPGFRTRTTSGGTVTLSIPAGFRGGDLGVVYVLDGADAATVVCTEGAATLATHALDGATMSYSALNSSIAVTRMIPALAAGAHTITLTFNSVTGSPGFNCYHVEAPDPPKIVATNIARLPTSSPWYGITPDATVATFNAAIQTFAGEFPPGDVLYLDIDAVVGGRGDILQGDGIHPNAAGHAIYAAEVARLLSPEEVFGPAQPLAPTDVPSVENGRCRVRFDTTGALGPYNVPVGSGPISAGFAIDLNVNGLWGESGKVTLQRDGFFTVDDVRYASVDECSPERAVIRVVMGSKVVAASRETVLITLKRGWPGPRIEWYPAPSASGTYPLMLIGCTAPSTGSPDSAMIIQSTGAAIVSTAAVGGTLPGPFPTVSGAAGLMDSENFLALQRNAFVTAQLTFAAVHQPVQAAAASTIGAYGTSLSMVGFVTANPASYNGMFIGQMPMLGNLFLEAEGMSLGAGTTNTAVGGSSGGNAARGTRTTDANAHCTQATWPNGRQCRARVFVRAKTSASTLNLYAKTTGTGGTTGATKTTTSAGYVWVDLGEVQCVGGALEIHAWSAAAATFDVDCIQAFKLEDRPPDAAYDGARDLARSVLCDATAVPGLVARGGP